MSIALSPERRDNVGASECAALWSLGWETRFGLYSRKAGLVEHDRDTENAALHLRVGQVLEPGIAKLVGEVQGWTLRKVRRYTKHPQIAGMGASLDYEVVAHEDGPGVVEIKAVDLGQFLRWGGVPPVQYELQVQHQLACTGRPWGALAVLVSNRKLEVYRRAAIPEIHKLIEREVVKFWEEVHLEQPPEPDYRTDGATLGRIYQASGAPVVDLSTNEEAQKWAVLYHRYGTVKRDADKEQQRAKAALVDMMKGAEVALLPYGKITSRPIPAKEMSYNRRASRSWHVTVEDVDGATEEGDNESE